MSLPPDTYNLAVPATHVVYSEILSVTSAMRKNARWATPTAYYPSHGRASLATSMGLRTGTQAGATVNTRVHSRREFDLMLGFEDLKRDIRGTSGARGPSLSHLHSKLKRPYRSVGYAAIGDTFSFPCTNTFATRHSSDYISGSQCASYILRMRVDFAQLTWNPTSTSRAQQHRFSLKI